MTAPTFDPALCIELGSRVVEALNQRDDWDYVLDRFLSWPVGYGPTVWEMSRERTRRA